VIFLVFARTARVRRSTIKLCNDFTIHF